MADFNTRDDGTPTAAHTWDEQFKALRDNGHVGPPPAENLLVRIGQLEAAIAAFPGHKARKGWAREIEWRRKQLERPKEESDGDAEHQV